MSTLFQGRSGICIVTGPDAIKWQSSQAMSIQKVVDGQLAVLSFDRVHACVASSLVHRGHEHIARQPTDNGTSVGASHTIVYPGEQTAWNLQTPTEPGGQQDANIASSCTSNNQARGKNAAGDGCERRGFMVHWLRNGEILSGGGTPRIGRNKRDVSKMAQHVKTQWGLSGNDHIIQWDTSVLVPTDPQIQVAGAVIVMIPLYYYCPDIGGTDFHVLKLVDVVTGAVSTPSGNPTALSTTSCIMCSTADGSFAMASVLGPGHPSPQYLGFFQTGLTSGYPESVVPTTPGKWRLPAALCVGTEADLTGPTNAIVTAHRDLPPAAFTPGTGGLIQLDS